jgi:hypothetical protein
MPGHSFQLALYCVVGGMAYDVVMLSNEVLTIDRFASTDDIFIVNALIVKDTCCCLLE